MIILHDWPTIAARSDEGSLRQLRPIMARLSNGSLLVSADVPGLRDAKARIDYEDLIEYQSHIGTGDYAQQRLVSHISQQLHQQRQVYYLYTRWEDGIDYEGNGRSGFGHFWQAVTANFTVTMLQQSPPNDDPNVRPWALYEVTQATH
jgi:hypothetical protein